MDKAHFSLLPPEPIRKSEADYPLLFGLLSGLNIGDPLYDKFSIGELRLIAQTGTTLTSTSLSFTIGVSLSILSYDQTWTRRTKLSTAVDKRTVVLHSRPYSHNEIEHYH